MNKKLVDTNIHTVACAVLEDVERAREAGMDARRASQLVLMLYAAGIVNAARALTMTDVDPGEMMDIMGHVADCIDVYSKEGLVAMQETLVELEAFK